MLRVPGFLNRKHGDPHQVRIVSSPGWRYSRAEILAAFPPVERSQQTKAKARPMVLAHTAKRDETIVKIGVSAMPCSASMPASVTSGLRWAWQSRRTMARPAERCGTSGQLTAKDKYNPDDQDRVWRSFKGSGVGIGTLFHYARHGGWEDSTKKLYEEWCRRQATER